MWGVRPAHDRADQHRRFSHDVLYVCDHLAEERSLREAEAIADAGASSPVPMTGFSGGGVVAAPAALQRLQPISLGNAEDRACLSRSRSP